MNSKDLIELIIDNMKNLIPLKDAIDCLTKEIMDVGVQNKLVESSVTLVSQISQAHPNVKNEQEQLILALKKSSTEVLGYYREWCGIVNADLFEGVMLLQEKEYVFQPSEVKYIIDYVISVEYDDELVLDELFVFFTKFGHYLPMETFGIGMFILERYGYIKSNPEVHPDYVYSKENDTQHEICECPVCGEIGEPHRTVYALKRRNFTNPHLPFKLYMRCDNCDNCYTRYISSEYYDNISEVRSISPKVADVFLNVIKFTELNYYCEIFKKIQQYNNTKEMLNIGIGVGAIIAVGLELGYIVSGLDKSYQNAQNVASMLEGPIYFGDIENFKIDKTYPVIMIEKTLEYEIDPKASLKIIYDLLDDDGILWLSTRNYKSAYSRLKKEHCEIWLDPLIVTLFSKDGLEKLLADCGFIVLDYSISRSNDGFMELLVQKNNSEDSNFEILE